MSDITASSDSGIQGPVTLNRPDVDPSRGLSELPEEALDPTREIDQGCAVGREDESRLIITERGGLPQSPTEVISPDMVQDDFGTPVTIHLPTGESVKPSPTTQPKQLVEAQGWVVDELGAVTLVAAAPSVTPHSGALVPASCHRTGGQQEN